jgi:AraC family transcriptional regulator
MNMHSVVAVVKSAKASWSGINVCVSDLVWRSVPAWHDVSSSAPVVHSILEEVGGRCELRAVPDEAAESEFYGPSAIGYVPADVPAFIYSAQIREARLASFEFDLHAIERVAPGSAQRIALAAPRLMFSDARIRECASLLASECAEPGNGARYGEGVAQSLLASVLDAITNRAPQGRHLSRQQFAAVEKFIDERLKETVSVEDIAATTELSPATFSRAFSRSTGSSPQRWHMQARVRRAQRLMIDNRSHSLADIAAMTGFADPSHFSRTFSQIIGTTPREWLRKRS